MSIKSIFNSITFPIFIVKEDLNEIVFQNQSAIQFCRKYRRNAQKGDYNFRDIFFLESQEDIQIFKDLLKNSLENNETNFLFPFYTEEIKRRKFSASNFNLNLDMINSMEENIKLIKIYCFSCEWKDKIPCYYPYCNKSYISEQKLNYHIQHTHTSYYQNPVCREHAYTRLKSARSNLKC